MADAHPRLGGMSNGGTPKTTCEVQKNAQESLWFLRRQSLVYRL
jgi:hypothetical protein